MLAMALIAVMVANLMMGGCCFFPDFYLDWSRLILLCGSVIFVPFVVMGTESVDTVQQRGHASDAGFIRCSLKDFGQAVSIYAGSLRMGPYVSDCRTGFVHSARTGLLSASGIVGI